jgi:DNA-binding NarL/FixJ family response regulator
MNVLIIDDHSLFRHGVESALRDLQQDTNVWGFENYQQAASELSTLGEIELVIMNFATIGTSKAQNFDSIRENFNNAKFILLSDEEYPEKIIFAIGAGVSGFISKRSDPALLLAALRLVLANGIYLPESTLRYLADNHLQHRTKPTNLLEQLTDRQLQILEHVVAGKSNKNIARAVNLSLGTVKAHLSSTYDRLGVSNRTEAVVLANQYLNKDK